MRKHLIKIIIVFKGTYLKIYCVIFFTYIYSIGYTQQVPRSTLYMLHQNSYNPAETAIDELGDINIVVREQYLNFPKSSGPQAIWFNTSFPLTFLHSGIGISLRNQTQGFENRMDFKLNYSYKIKLQSGILSLGLSLGGANLGWDIENPIYPDGSTDTYIDTKIASQENFLNFLFDFGVYYKIKNIYTSFAITEMNQPQLKYESSSGQFYKRHFWYSLGYEYKTSNPMLTIQPSLLVKSTLTSTQLNLDALFVYNKTIIGGLSYSSSNDISVIFGAKFGENRKFNGMRAFFSYDIVNSKIATQTVGSLEFMVGYSFALSVDKVNKSYKSVRFL